MRLSSTISLAMPGTFDNKQRTFFDSPQNVWRPIHYLGSKLRLTDSIGSLLDELSKGTVCDLFAGSGTVSLALSHSRTVVAADIQEYSRVLCTAILRPVPITDHEVIELTVRAQQCQKKLEPFLEPLLDYEQRAIELAETHPELLCDLVENGSLLLESHADGKLLKALEETKRRIKAGGRSLLVTTYFGGRYFSYKQSLSLDSLLNEIEGETCLAAVLSTASTIVNSVGKQFAQPLRPRRRDGSIKTHLIQQMCRDRMEDAGRIFADWLSRYRSVVQKRPHQVFRGDFRSVLANLENVDVIYADPPYTRDHYSRFYHVLETLCLRDNPAISSTFMSGPISRGLYRTDRHQSPFCIKSKAPTAFMELFSGANGRPLLISYSPFVKDGHPRLMTIEAITALAKKHYKSVKVVPATIAHSKLNKTSLHLDASNNAEVFIACR